MPTSGVLTPNVPVLDNKFGTKKSDVQEKITVPPLNSERLRPVKHKTSHAIYHIRECGEVVVEFIKFMAQYNEERVVNICRISKDGLRILIYNPDPGRYVIWKKCFTIYVLSYNNF